MPIVRSVETAQPPVRQKRTPRRSVVTRGFLFLAAVVVAIAFVAPFVYAIVSSFKTAAEANAAPPVLVPSAISTENYRTLTNFGIGISGTSRTA